MATGREIDPELAQTVEHDLRAAFVPLQSSLWVFHRATFAEDSNGIRGARTITVRSTGSTIDGASFPWKDAERGYRLEVLSIQGSALPEKPPAAVWWGEPYEAPAPETGRAATLAILRARAIPPRGRVFAQIEWRPGWGEPEYAYGGVQPGARGTTNRTQLANIGFSLLAAFQRRGAGGRPRKGEAEIRATVDPIVCGLKKRGFDPTEERVAELLPQKRGVYRDPRVLRRWINEVLLMDWEEYVASVES